MSKNYKFLLLLLILFPTLVSAQNVFNPNFIISDEEMQDDTTMNSYEINKFLDAKASYLSNYKTKDIDGKTKKASEIISNAAKVYDINPKYILVTLQKEQSLITTKSPTQKQLDWATGYAVCDSCSMNDPKVMKYQGFAKQVDNSAGIIRWYYDNTDHPVVKQKNETVKIDSKSVKPESWATAFLYTYTPHLHGNENFWSIWNDWFAQGYPNGTLLKAVGAEDYWLIQDGKRKRFKNITSLVTRTDPKYAVIVPDTELKNYQIGSEITLPNYSILKNGSKYYLIDNYTIRQFKDYKVVQKLGYNPQEIVEVTSSDIQGYETGTVITVENSSPTGIIFYITDLKEYFLLKDNILKPILSRSVVDANYNDLPLEKHNKGVLKNYNVVYEPINFKNGTLLTADGLTYVMEDSKKRLIPDVKTFLAMGYKNENVIQTTVITTMGIPSGEKVFLRSSLENNNIHLLNRQQKIENLFKTTLPAYLVAEYPSGFVLTGKNVTTTRPIASLTKILTAYQAIDLNFNPSKFTIYNAKKHSAYGNYLKLVDGEKIKNEDLFNSMLVGSVNNTARMVAASTGFTEENFVKKLNTNLVDWRLDDTKIEEVTGLSEKNVSTPLDMLAIFTKALEKEEIKKSLGLPRYDFTELYDKNGIREHGFTHSNTLAIPGYVNKNYEIIASKTGYIDESGAHVLMLIESKKDKKQYVVLTMGDRNWAKRFTEPHRLATWVVDEKFNLASK